MSSVVWKATLEPLDRQRVKVPTGAEFLCAHEQRERICVWYRCDPAQPMTQRLIAIVGTGNDTPPAGGGYIGTAFIGEFVFHVFDQTEVLLPHLTS